MQQVSTKTLDIKNGRAFPFRFYLIAAIVTISTIVQEDYRGFIFLLIPLIGITANRGTQFKALIDVIFCGGLKIWNLGRGEGRRAIGINRVGDEYSNLFLFWSS